MISVSIGRIVGLLLLLSALTACTTARADYTLTIDKHENRGTWQGWGCSLCWWANAVGGSTYQDLYADLFFTQKTIPFMGVDLPGLGLNIVRYNVGGGGRSDNTGGATENIPPKFPWFKHIEGYWVNWYDKASSSKSWDWSRDANQRSMLLAAA